jgi:hypothetical protein
MVRAVKLETSASGTYYNSSQGAFLTPGAGDSPAPAVQVADSRAKMRRSSIDAN